MAKQRLLLYEVDGSPALTKSGEHISLGASGRLPRNIRLSPQVSSLRHMRPYEGVRALKDLLDLSLVDAQTLYTNLDSLSSAKKLEVIKEMSDEGNKRKRSQKHNTTKRDERAAERG